MSPKELVDYLVRTSGTGLVLKFEHHEHNGMVVHGTFIYRGDEIGKADVKHRDSRAPTIERFAQAAAVELGQKFEQQVAHVQTQQQQRVYLRDFVQKHNEEHHEVARERISNGR